MTIQECYSLLGNYDEVTARLGSEKLICKYLKKFRLDDTFSSLCSAMERKDPKEAFLYVHNLKGLYLNLGMTHAAQAASRLCEALRAGSFPDEAPAMMEDVRQKQEQLLTVLADLFDSAKESEEQSV